MTHPTHAVVAIEDPNTGAVLLTKRAVTLRLHPGEYCFPGGRIETGETVLDAALRELYEETHLRASTLILDVPRAHLLPRSVTTYTTHTTFAVLYTQACDAASLLPMIKLNPDEAVSAKWFDPTQCVIGPKTSNRGVIRIIDRTDGAVIEGATADVVTALFATRRKQK